jgi:hypothetical protein
MTTNNKSSYFNSLGEMVDANNDVIEEIKENVKCDGIRLKKYPKLKSQIQKKDDYNNNTLIEYLTSKRLDKDSMVEYVFSNLPKIMAIINDSGHKYYVITDKKDYQNEDIDNYSYPYYFFKGGNGSKAGIETRKMYKLKDMIQDYGGVFIYDYSVFNPTLTNSREEVYNTFMISKYHYVDYNPNIDTSTFFNYVSEIVCDNDTDNYEDLLNWISFVIQKRKTSGVMPILKGKSGDGKSMLYQTMELLIGKKYCKTFNHPSEVLGHFNHHLKEILLISIEELGVMNSKDQNLLKDFITNSSNKAITGKGKDTEFYDLYYNIMATTNEEKTVDCDTDTRRQIFLEVNQKYIQEGGTTKFTKEEEDRNQISLDYWTKYTKTVLVDDDILGQIYHFFKTRDISNVNIRKLVNTKMRQNLVKKQEDKRNCEFLSQLSKGHFISLIQQNTIDYKEKDTKYKKRGISLDILYEAYKNHQEKSGVAKNYIPHIATFKTDLERKLNITPSLGKPIKSLKKDVMTYYDLSFILLEHKDDEEKEEKEEKENIDGDGLNDLQF